MKLDQETAEAIVRLMASRDFQVFLTYLDTVESGLIQGAIYGHDENQNADVLRGRAQGLGIFRAEITKAPDVAGRIQKVS